jgi:hypothetical protein
MYAHDLDLALFSILSFIMGVIPVTSNKKRLAVFLSGIGTKSALPL